ncbi:hypothetical protein [Liquorilactobacillus hordei]|uniref:Uncharacterized protein n=1 Tax=Liquorilactobacillus hordei TaxID=468911 RepID=A0A3Q8CC04_9LACO|nr:hypothetical protein [Liquorilactobacillus hordei]AUJ29618.1 hypothetical protein BSQ49_05030 [Liquorilactobacillus hordei]
MGFEIARNEDNNTLLTFDEIRKSDDLDNLRYKLLCPTPNCKAHLSYVASIHPYIKTRNESEHSDFCEYKKDEGAKEIIRKKAKEKILVNLGEADVYARLDDLGDDLYPNRVKKPRKKRGKKSNKTDSESGDGVQLIPGENGIDINELSSDKKRFVGPRVPKKTLTEFTAQDKGRIFKIPAKLLSIEKNSDRRYYLKIKSIEGNKKGTLILKEAFFSRNIQNINVFLDFLMNVVNEKKIEVKVAAYGTLINFENRDFEIFKDYGLRFFTENKGVIRKDSLVLFYNYYANKKFN